MVQVSKNYTPNSPKYGKSAALRVFVSCIILVAILDVRTLRFLRNKSSRIRGFSVNTTTTTADSTLSDGTKDLNTVDESKADSLEVKVFQTEKAIEAAAASDKRDKNVVASPQEKPALAQKMADKKVKDVSTVEASQSTMTKASKNTTKTCLDPAGPVPYILLARGRSGSGSTMQVLGKLTPGDHIPGDLEFTGSTPGQARKFFSRVEQTNGTWVTDNLCDLQRKHPKAGLVAFKWKPYTEAMFSPAALAGLDLISRSVNPVIKVVRLRRNLLDNYISDQKHELARVEPHCSPGNLRCVNRHKAAGTNLTLSVPDLLAFLEEQATQEDTVDAFLVNMSVPHVQVSYEKLYHQDNAEEWMRIFRFLGVGPGEGLTREQVDGNAHAFTGSSHHREAILNFNQVEQGLKGTRFEGLLRP